MCPTRLHQSISPRWWNLLSSLPLAVETSVSNVACGGIFRSYTSRRRASLLWQGRELALPSYERLCLPTTAPIWYKNDGKPFLVSWASGVPSLQTRLGCSLQQKTQYRESERLKFSHTWGLLVSDIFVASGHAGRPLPPPLLLSPPPLYERHSNGLLA